MAKKRGKKREMQSDFNREITDDSFIRMMDESLQPVKAIEVGDEIKSTVIGIDNEYVYVDLGDRYDGAIRKGELMRYGEMLVDEGDVVTVIISGQGGGFWKCSCKLGEGEFIARDPEEVAAIMGIGEAFKTGTPVEGKITEVTKGGFDVDIMGMRAFCPLSQIDIAYCENPDEHLEKTYKFEIIEFEEDDKNIVVSRKNFLAHEAKKIADKLWRDVNEGGVYKGTVKSIQSFGAFIDIGGIEGLLHISEISYERLESAADVLNEGQVLDVAVKGVDREKRKLSLSLKSLMDDPWTAAIKKLKAGGEFQGKVLRLKTFGAFVELFPGVDGLVHISRLGTDRNHKHPKEVLKVGEIVTVRVLDIDEEGHKISLTMEKEEVDYTKDLARLKKEQDKAVKSGPTHMANLFDAALKK